ncbi:alkaline phosphatase family protein [Siminovitchia fortis]|uniref:Alkaline phosphatase family protein n=1 Tax=Siminovitchia fortis TaxID=254758 RepID=A0A443IPH5_9BACI|nr:alkaline phosphatase family protein [Siminovitchia fortis]RWR08093.1 alkaline phosphatase family protein [Siminovitchia fortis]WHY81049.1 alkaline phosphatase family protein [Siminovitchia fortis]
MKIRTAFIFIFCVLIFPSIASAETQVVISFDGMRHDFLGDFMKNGSMPHFKKVAETGMYAEKIETVYPSLTSASHAAIATGASPSKTGMVSNEIHKPGQKLPDRDNAFFSPLDAEPIWSKARKEGKTTAAILFPGSNPKFGNQADYAIYYGKTWAESELVPIHFKEKKAEFALSKNYKVYIQAADSNTFHVSFDPDMKNAEKVALNEWGSLSFYTESGDLAGFSFKLKSSKPDLSDAKLYRTAVTSAEIAGPPGFKKEINEKFGFFPVQDDDIALVKKWITRKEYEEICERFAQWTTDVSLYIKEKYSPDLLFFYYPQVDHESHKYLLADPRQPGYSEERSRQYMGYIHWSYRLADDMLGQILPKLGAKDRLFLVSDHGMEPVHSKLSPNEELKKSGLLVQDRDGKVDVSKSKAFAVSSGSIAHVYINLRGREKGGIVGKDEYEAVRREVVDVFKKAEVEKKHFPLQDYVFYGFAAWWDKIVHEKGNVTGAAGSVKKAVSLASEEKIRPYQDVLLRGRTAAVNHENAGDVILVAKKGYYMAQDEGNEVMMPDELGNHGGDPSRPELFPIFIAAGDGISAGTIETPVSTLDIAPTLYELLGVRQPDFVEGKAIRELSVSEDG